MQTLSSAMRTCIASESAVECTATVPMPISRAARMTRSAISPRLAIRIFSNMRALLDDHQRRAEFHRCPVFDEHPLDDTAGPRVDVVHRLHRLDDEQGLAFLDRVADPHERGGGRLGREIDGA